MLTVMRILVVALLLGMTLCPLGVYLVFRRVHADIIRRRRGIFIAYLTAAGITICLAVTVHRAYLSILFWIALVGPFIGAEMISFLRSSSSGLCKKCGYDLTGNTSGICPECGIATTNATIKAASASLRFRAAPWRTLLVAYPLTVLLLLIAVGYASVQTTYYCSECARIRHSFAHSFNVPLNDVELFSLTAGERMPPDQERINPLISYLDPDKSCEHVWVGSSESWWGVLGWCCGIGNDPIDSFPSFEPEFESFVTAHPDVLDRIRMSLRQRQSYGGWLMEEYYAWEDDRN